LKKASPNHIAIIMDGNGRWAKFKKAARAEGHKEGALVARRITEYCATSDVKFLTLYAFSTENWNRPKAEVAFLMKLLEGYLEKELDGYVQNNIKFQTIGDMSKLSEKLVKRIESLKNATKNNTALTQTLAINYGAKDEMLRAINKLYGKKDIGEADFDNALDTANMPPVDMLVRTGGEKRLSNFLLWQSAYAELFFTDTLWPDFHATELARLIDEFQYRDRRFGGV
jgi:undecaprenyl diphosphate synthase